MSPTLIDIINDFNKRRAQAVLAILDEAIARAEQEYDDVTLIDMLRAAKWDVRDMGCPWPERRERVG